MHAFEYKKALNYAEVELTSFLMMKGSVTLATATPVHVLAYLVNKDLGTKINTHMGTYDSVHDFHVRL